MQAETRDRSGVATLRKDLSHSPFGFSLFLLLTARQYKQRVMKVIYYRGLLGSQKWSDAANKITYNERLLYSFFVSKAITYCSDFFDSNGNTINQEELTISMQYDQFFEIPRMTVDKISEELHISRRSVIYAKESLLAKSYTRKNEYDKLCVYIDEGLLVGGYFEIRFEGKLNGGALIFYSFLLDKCERYFFKAKKECTYCIDTYRYKLASEFGESEDSIKMFLRQIYDKKLAKRLKNKKLQLYLTPQEND